MEIVRSRSHARMCTRHSNQCGGAECYGPAHSQPHYATGGNSAFLLGHATGTQGYVCLPKDTGASWTVNAARPEATLFQRFLGQDFEIVTHFLSPNEKPNGIAAPLFANATWQSSLDSSKVWAQVLNMIIRSLPAPTRVARIPARLPASYCKQLVLKRGQPEAKSWPIPPSSNG